MTLEKDGIRNVNKNYGTRETNGKYGGVTDGDAFIKTAVWDFAYNDLPDAGATDQEHIIPAGSTIVSAHLRIITAFTSTSTTTDLDVGLQRADGTQIDDNGLITATEATQTTIAVAGAYIAGAGALIGKISDATYNGELVVTPTVNDLTAGRGQVVVKYIPPAV